VNRPSFHRLAAVGVLALAVLATAAAPTSAAPTTNRASDQRIASTSGASSIEDASVLSVRGAGPYRIGARLQELTASGLISWTDTLPDCDVVYAGATGDWAGVIIVAFRNGRLVAVGTATAPPVSPSGASVGMAWDQFEEIYGSRGEFVYNDDGDRAYAVRIGAGVELYTGHPIRSGVGYFQAGRANFILGNFLRGSPC
jgi:hypothetical protein